MAKKNAQTKETKKATTINKQSNKEIKEKMTNKEEDMVKNEQIIEKKMGSKREQKIHSEMTKKSVQNEQTIEEQSSPEPINEKPAPDVSTDDLVKVLKIPMNDAKVEPEPVDVHNALFDNEQEVEEPEFEDDDIEEENLNDKYFGSSDDLDDDFDDTFFSDSKLMAEMGTEMIDIGMSTLAQFLAKDFDNPEKYQISEYRKNKLKKPLAQLLRKRGAKVSPEVMFGVTLLVIYSPILIIAMQERKKKKQESQQTQDIAEQIPENIQRVMPQPKPVATPPPAEPPTANPMVVPIEPQKKKGRPKGSKDNKKRSTKGYKGNKNNANAK